MMTSKEFDIEMAKYAENTLSPLGFKKIGAKYYIHKAPNIMVLYKSTFRETFKGFAISLTHDFLSNTFDENNKIRIPSYPEEFPFSIPLEDLKLQYSKFGTVKDFDFDTNFLTREIMPTRRFSGKRNLNDIAYNYTRDLPSYTQEYIDSSIDIMLKEGMKLWEEFSPIISYLSVTRHGINDGNTLSRFKKELENYFEKNNIRYPKSRFSWLKRFLR